MIGRSGDRGSGISVLAARHDDDDDDDIYIYIYVYIFMCVCVCVCVVLNTLFCIIFLICFFHSFLLLTTPSTGGLHWSLRD